MADLKLLQPAIFLDRDGTLIKDAGYLSSVDGMEVFDFTLEALRRFKEAGYLLIVITNQSGIARGYFDVATMHSINNDIQSRIGDLIDAFYFCPHGPGDNCDCRKPKSGMINQAAIDLRIDLANSWVIGDKKSDIETGFNTRLGTALVLTGYGEAELKTLDRMPDIVAGNLLDAAKQICSRND